LTPSLLFLIHFSIFNLAVLFVFLFQFFIFLDLTSQIICFKMLEVNFYTHPNLYSKIHFKMSDHLILFSFSHITLQLSYLFHLPLKFLLSFVNYHFLYWENLPDFTILLYFFHFVRIGTLNLFFPNFKQEYINHVILIFHHLWF
jgi:hypothetical protein